MLFSKWGSNLSKGTKISLLNSQKMILQRQMSVKMSVKFSEYGGILRDARAQNLYKIEEINLVLASRKRSTDQKVGGSNPSGRASIFFTFASHLSDSVNLC